MMDVLFGFEVPRRKRLRNEPGVVSTPCLVRGEPMCFLKLRGEATGIGLAMLFFKEAVSLRACSSEICSWLRPATPFMRAFMQCSPVGCLLRSWLATHVSPFVLAAIQEICWANFPMGLPWTRPKRVRRSKSRWPRASTQWGWAAGGVQLRPSSWCKEPFLLAQILLGHPDLQSSKGALCWK